MTQFVTNTRTLSTTDFAVPIDDRYFEDYTTGAIYEYGYLTVTEQDIVGFAGQSRNRSTPTGYSPKPARSPASSRAAGIQRGGELSAGMCNNMLFCDKMTSMRLSEWARARGFRTGPP
jgi:hypothetical protein